MIVNNEPRQAEDRSTVARLLEQLDRKKSKGLAVAVNGKVVAARDWPEHALSEGDEVLLIQSTQGG
ncbi:MAG: sulfur carrier protein ThiS [Opitutales bacterium]